MSGPRVWLHGTLHRVRPGLLVGRDGAFSTLPSSGSGPGEWCQSPPGKCPSSHTLLSTRLGFCTRISWASNCPRPCPATPFPDAPHHEESSSPVHPTAGPRLPLNRHKWELGQGVSCPQETRVWGGVRAHPNPLAICSSPVPAVGGPRVFLRAPRGGQTQPDIPVWGLGTPATLKRSAEENKNPQTDCHLEPPGCPHLSCRCQRGALSLLSSGT